MFKHQSLMHLATGRSAALSTTALDQAIDEAEINYRTFQAKLTYLIRTIKKQHGAMLNLNRLQMQSTAAICDFAVNTPLSQCVIGTDHSSQSSDNSKRCKHKAVLRYKEEEKEKEEEEKKEKEGDDIDSNSSAGAKNMNPWTAGCSQSFESAIGYDCDGADESFVALTNSSNDLNLDYAEKYMEWIIGYLDEWDHIVSTRIGGKLIQFREMRKKYAHYTDKVQGLHGRVDKQNAKKAAGASARLEGKLDRNRIKLSGVEEAHNDFGRSLLSLMEEVLMHYWKDMVPLLHMIIKFNINHSSDLADVMKRLEKTDIILKNVCDDHGVSITGRLQDLKPEPVPENFKVDESREEAETKEDEEIGDEDDDSSSVGI